MDFKIPMFRQGALYLHVRPEFVTDALPYFPPDRKSPVWVCRKEGRMFLKVLDQSEENILLEWLQSVGRSGRTFADLWLKFRVATYGHQGTPLLEGEPPLDQPPWPRPKDLIPLRDALLPEETVRLFYSPCTGEEYLCLGGLALVKKFRESLDAGLAGLPVVADPSMDLLGFEMDNTWTGALELGKRQELEMLRDLLAQMSGDELRIGLNYTLGHLLGSEAMQQIVYEWVHMLEHIGGAGHLRNAFRPCHCGFYPLDAQFGGAHPVPGALAPAAGHLRRCGEGLHLRLQALHRRQETDVGGRQETNESG